jgi:hypothetical protein
MPEPVHGWCWCWVQRAIMSLRRQQCVACVPGLDKEQQPCMRTLLWGVSWYTLQQKVCFVEWPCLSCSAGCCRFLTHPCFRRASCALSFLCAALGIELNIPDRHCYVVCWVCWRATCMAWSRFFRCTNTTISLGAWQQQTTPSGCLICMQPGLAASPSCMMQAVCESSVLPGLAYGILWNTLT